MPNRGEPLEAYQREDTLERLARDERQLLEHSERPQIVESAHLDAALAACSLGYGDKAAEHFAVLTDDRERERALSFCIATGIWLREPAK